MKKLQIVILAISLVLLSQGVRAHQPDLSSTILSQQDEGRWILQIRSALTAFEYAVVDTYGDNSFATPEEFKHLVLQLVEGQVAIYINKEKAILKNGMTRLGHETSVTFEVEGITEDITEMEIINRSFRNISRNQSALYIVQDGIAKNQFTLNESNAHQAELILKDDILTRVNATDIKEARLSTLPHMWALAVIGAIVLTFLALSRKRIIIKN